MYDSNKRYKYDLSETKATTATKGKQLVVVGTPNLVTGTTNKYTLTYNSFVNYGENSEIALVQGQQFFSWNSIGTEFTNQTFSITWIDGVTESVVMPAGLYQVSDISAYIQFVMNNKGWFLTDTLGAAHYYFSLVPNATYGKVQYVATLLPSALAGDYAGWNYGVPAVSGAAWVTAALCPQIIIPPSPQEFGTLIGFSAGTYPAVNTSSASGLGDLYPQLSPISTVFVNCNLVNNPNTPINNSAMWAFNANGLTPRQSINYNIPEYVWLPIIQSQTRTVTIELTDQNGKPLNQTDTNASWTLYIRQRD